MDYCLANICNVMQQDASQNYTIHGKWLFVTIQGTLFKASVEYFWPAGKSSSPPPLLRLPRVHSWCAVMWDTQQKCCYIERACWVELMLKFNQRESLIDNAKFLALPYFTNLCLSQAFRWVVLLLCFKKKKNQDFWMGLNKNANYRSYESWLNEVTQAGWEVSKQWFSWISDPEDTAKSHCEFLIKSSCCSLGVSLLGIQVSRVSRWIS